MADLHIFNPYDERLVTLSNKGEKACPFWDANFKEELNKGSEFEFTCPATHDDSKHVVVENQVSFKDKDGNFRLFVIKETEETDDEDGPQIYAYCEPAMLELNDTVIEDKRPQDTTAKKALESALENTRWRVGEVAELGENSTNFYFETVTEAIMNILDVWGGEFRDRIEISGNGIVGRYIDILTRRGSDTGKRWEIDKDIIKISRVIQSYPKTALYGRGASLETEGEGYSRKLTFEEVEWSIEDGDPANKPKGQKWIGDSDALEMFGKPNDDGELLHRYGIFEDGNIEDPEELLEATWKELQKQKRPFSNFELDVLLYAKKAGLDHEKVRLGDTTIAIDRRFAQPIEVQERIIAFEYDVANPDDTGKVEFGQFIDLLGDDDRIDNIETRLDKTQGKANNPVVDDDNYPDKVPPVPENFKAEGLFKTIQLKWDFDASSYIAAYEVYASQNKGFEPTSDRMVWRGKSGGYAFDAGTEEKWYFRVRAVNTHGTGSDYTDEKSATTAQLDLPDLEDIVPDFIEYSIYEGDEAPDSDKYKYWLDTAENELKRWDDNKEEWVDLSQTDAIEDLNEIADELKQAVRDHDGKITTVETDIDDIEGKLNVTIESLEEAEDDISSNKSSIEANEDAIKLKASRSEFDKVAEDVSDIESELSVISDEIKARVEKKELEEVEDDVKKVSADVSSLTVDVEGIEADVSNLSEKVDEHGYTIEDHTSTIEQHADEISQKVEAEFVEAEIGKIDLDNRNLVLGTSEERSGTLVVYRVVPSLLADLEDEKVTLSFEAKTEDSVEFSGGLSVNDESLFEEDFIGTNGEWNSFEVTFNLEGVEGLEDDDSALILFVENVSIRNLKLEKGEESTRWTPAPEDTGDITARVSEAESEISQQADEIELRVEKNDVISTINQTPESVKIEAERIEIEGDLEVDDGKVYIKEGIITDDLISSDAKIDFAKIANIEITDAEIVDVKGDKIEAGKIVDEKGNIEFNLDDGTLYIKGGSIEVDGGIPDDQIEGAEKWNKQGTYIDEDGVYTGKVVANQIEGGVLRSLNRNTTFNLNDGELSMKEASFSLSSGASITFQHPRNTITYFNERTAGLGVGDSEGGKSIVFIGTTKEGESFRARDESDFKGFVSNSATGGGEVVNTVAGDIFRVRNNIGDHEIGFSFEHYKSSSIGDSTSLIRPLSSNHRANIGDFSRPITGVYAESVFADEIEGKVKGLSSLDLKRNVKEMPLKHSLEFVRNNKIIEFDWKNKDDDKQVGFAIDHLEMEKEEYVKSDDKTYKLSNIVFMNQQVTQYLLNEIERLKELITDE